MTVKSGIDKCYHNPPRH